MTTVSIERTIIRKRLKDLPVVQLKEMAEHLTTMTDQGSDYVFSETLDELNDRMGDEEYIAFMTHLETIMDAK